MTQEYALDAKAWALLSALQADGRAPLKALAEAAGLSVAATAERLKRLQEAGVLRGVRAEIDLESVGYGVQALVGITALQPAKKALLERLRKAPEVLECHHVAGADSYQLMVAAENLAALETFLSSINGYGETRTAIVFSTPIPRRGVLRPGSAKRA